MVPYVPYSVPPPALFNLNVSIVGTKLMDGEKDGIFEMDGISVGARVGV